MNEGMMKSTEVKSRIAKLGAYVAKAKALDPRKFPEEEFELFSVPSHAEGKPEVVLGKTVGASKQAVEDDTVLLCKINPRINRTWVVSSHTGHRKIASSEWMTFPPSPDFLPKYLGYYLQQDELRDHLALNASGVGGSLMRAKPGLVKDYPFPLFPLPEQRRIVSAIETQLGRLDAAVARLHAAKAKLKRYKQAVLKAAVEGRLFNDELDEGELPAGWEWTTLGDAVELVSGGTPKGVNDAKNEGAIPFFKVGDMTLDGNDRYMETSRAYLSEQDAKRLKLTIYPAGTVIFPKRGGAILTNKKRVLSGPGAFDLNLMGALPSATIDSDFLYYWFEQLDLSKIYDGSNIPQINKKNVDPLPFVKPPITEQRRIADELDRLLDSTNEMETTLDAQLSQSTRLRQSVLKRAFEGRLV